MKHDLKIWPQFFQPVAEGTKTFEVRENDRGYQPGDIVTLREYDPELCNGGRGVLVPRGYTGKDLTFKIGYVLPIAGGVVVFSLLPQEGSATTTPVGKEYLHNMAMLRDAAHKAFTGWVNQKGDLSTRMSRMHEVLDVLTANDSEPSNKP